MPRFVGVSVLAIVFSALATTLAATDEPQQDKPATKKLNVAVVTGGHDFNQKEFFKLFQGYDDIAYKHFPQKTGGEIFDDIVDWPYDAIVLYNFARQITPRQQKNFLKLLDRGVGLVILHHANAAYMNWPLFWKIAGVEYHFATWEQNGRKMAPSGYTSDVWFKIHVADPKHPITQGLADYDFLDETYCRTSVAPDVHALLTTDEPSSDKTIGWVKTYSNSKVCYLQSGHDPKAYSNPNYRTLVVRAIRWACKKNPMPGAP